MPSARAISAVLMPDFANSRIFSDRVGLRRTRTDKATTTTEDYLPGAVCGAADGFELELEPVEGQPEAKSWFG